MRSSWLCWWVLLTWALLGPAVSGQEAVPWEGAEEPAVESEVELDMVEEPEGPLEPEAEEEPDDEVEPDWDWEEELESRAESYRHILEDELRHGWAWSPIGDLKRTAIRSLQLRANDEIDPFGEPGAIYRSLEDSSVLIQKAIGNIITFTMFVIEGECPEEDQVPHSPYPDDRLPFRPRPPPRSPTCKKLDCVFTVFHDMRTHHDAVIDNECHPLLLVEDLLYDREEDYAAPLDDDVLDLPDPEETTPAYEDFTPDFPSSAETNFPSSNEVTADFPSTEETSAAF
ncbi:hypothetical protein lerEdw1_007351 [Lerista edwardsae]|nr:hypothetical protein lerEdw1_007351 [Lerista edwardsae]